jgi:hypothetical protein
MTRSAVGWPGPIRDTGAETAAWLAPRSRDHSVVFPSILGPASGCSRKAQAVPLRLVQAKPVGQELR